MPWKVREVMTLRKEFIQLATQPDRNIRELCRRFGISPKTGYKWLGRFTGPGGWAEYNESYGSSCASGSLPTINSPSFAMTWLNAGLP